MSNEYQCPKCGKYLSLEGDATFYDWVGGHLTPFCNEVCYVMWLANGNTPRNPEHEREPESA